MPQAICSSSEMKQGTSRSRASRADRPQHRVRAAAHHAHALAAMMASSRASSARVTSPFVPDGAVLGGQEAARGPSPPSRAAAPDPARRGRRRASRSASTSRCAAASAPCMYMGGSPTPPATSRSTRIGIGRREARPERTEHVDLGAGQRTLEQSGAPTDGFGQHIGRPVGRRDRHQRESSGQQAGRAPKHLESLRIVRVWPQPATRSRRAAKRSNRPQVPDFPRSLPGSSASCFGRLCTANVAGFLS